MTLRQENLTWVRGVFGTAPNMLGRRNTQLNPKSSAELKFADTTLGGNAAINAPPQFTRFADPAYTGLFATSGSRIDGETASMWVNENNAGSYRLGRRYSEIIDDNAQYVHMRFGVPKWTGAFTFFANMYNRDMARLAKTGEYSSTMRTLGQAAGFGAMFALVPLPVLVPLLAVGQVLKYAMSKEPSRYYYLNPTMNTYLQAVQAMADTQLLHSRLVPMWNVIGDDRYIDVEDPRNQLSGTMEEVYSSLPDIWKSNGKFDVFKMITRHQTLANYQTMELERIYAGATSAEQLEGALNAYLQKAQSEAYLLEALNDDDLNLQNLVKAYTENQLYQMSPEDELAEQKRWDDIQSELRGVEGVSADNVVNEQNAAAGTVKPEKLTNASFWDGMVDFFSNFSEQLTAELKDGGQWVTFKVDGKSAYSDSFSSSSKQADIQSKLNSMASTASSLNVSTSGGNTGFGFIDQTTKGIKDFLGGALDTLNLSGLSAIYGAAYTDIPEVWEASQASVGTQSFTLQLRSPYGDDLSLFQNITVPLIMVLAMVLPLAAGRQTHVAPFLCEMYCRGRNNIRLGMVDSVQITRGVGNVGWRPDGKMLGCDITLNVKDLSRVMTMPIITDPGLFDDDNMFTDYMATLGGASLQDMTYTLNRMTFNLNKWKQSWKSYFMAGRITNSLSNTWPVRQLAGLTAGVSL